MFHSSLPYKPEGLDPKNFLRDLADLNNQYHGLLKDDELVRQNPVLQLENIPDQDAADADSSQNIASATEDLSDQIAKLQIEALDLKTLREQIQNIYEGTLARVTTVDPSLEDLDLSTYQTHSFNPAKADQGRALPSEEFKGVISEVLPDGSFRIDMVNKSQNSRRIITLNKDGEPLITVKFL